MGFRFTSEVLYSKKSGLPITFTLKKADTKLMNFILSIPNNMTVGAFYNIFCNLFFPEPFQTLVEK